MENIEHKNFEVKLDDVDEKGIFTGYASIFGNIDNGRDIVQKGAFTESLKTIKPKFVWQHDIKQPIGSLDLEEDNIGLKIKEGRYNLDVQKAREAYSLVKKGDIDGFSIGYVVTKERFDDVRKARIIEEALVYEISQVTMPMNELATVTSVKSDIPEEEKPEIKIDDVNDLKDITTFLKCKGLTKSERTAIISKIKSFVINEYKENQAGEMLVKSIQDLITSAATA